MRMWAPPSMVVPSHFHSLPVSFAFPRCSHTLAVAAPEETRAHRPPSVAAMLLSESPPGLQSLYTLVSFAPALHTSLAQPEAPLSHHALSPSVWDLVPGWGSYETPGWERHEQSCRAALPGDKGGGGTGWELRSGGSAHHGQLWKWEEVARLPAVSSLHSAPHACCTMASGN